MILPLTLFNSRLILLDDFVAVKAETYFVGKQGRVDNPRRQVKLKGFVIAKFETTNEQFEQFVKETGYLTDAETLHNAMVFEPGLEEFRWIQDQSATWRNPNGVRRDSIRGKDQHPVTSISYHDATVYCKWAKGRLPTLDEWEVSCRCGTSTDTFFGDDLSLISGYANVWLGRNHLKSDESDGYLTTSPVGSFLPNSWGLYDTYGNVFEFCSGRLKSDKSKSIVHARGGSWWCSKNSCCFFNSVDIGKVDRKASFSNQGFRMAKDLD